MVAAAFTTVRFTFTTVRGELAFLCGHTRFGLGGLALPHRTVARGSGMLAPFGGIRARGRVLSPTIHLRGVEKPVLGRSDRLALIRDPVAFIGDSVALIRDVISISLLDHAPSLSAVVPAEQGTLTIILGERPPDQSYVNSSRQTR